VQTICYLLESILPTMIGPQKSQENMEMQFVFCVTWAFGGPLMVDKGHGLDSRKDFNDMFAATFANIQYPKDGMCFDYFYSHESNEWQHWSTVVHAYEPIKIGTGHGAVAFKTINVHTVDTTRLSSLMNQLASNAHNVMFVGSAGTGKTAMVGQFLNSMDESMLFTNINMNYFTDSKALQALLEQNIDKRSGRMFGPPATKRMIYFVDDLNLPYVEDYGTQNALELLRQVMDHGSIFDRIDLGFRKEIVDTQQIAAMNPLIGSFEVSERNQLKYATFACMMPGLDDLRTIYSSIMDGHMKLDGGFGKGANDLCHTLVDSTIAVHTEVLHKFLPSAIKFVYNWNMRELGNIFQGLTLAQGQFFPDGMSLARLWLHECIRVFSDRMVDTSENDKFMECVKHAVGKDLHCLNQDDLFAMPNIFTAFHKPIVPTVYVPVEGMSKLSQVLQDRLTEYNESNAMMDLVLFNDAMEHICRIARVISNPSGNAMLIGVGGSGKQSLAKLATFICGYETQQLSVTSNYKVDDFREALKEMYKQAGVKGIPLSLVMTDSQIVKEEFLVYINDMLASGWIPDLFARDEMDGLFGALRNEAKSQGIGDDPHSMLDFFLMRVRMNMHIILCFSPVGDTFRVRARRFPGLINSTCIDWFHAWPQDALEDVAKKFLDEVDLNTEEIKAQCSLHMAQVHLSVTAASVKLLKTRRRFNYVTPKSFLELIAFYKQLLGTKRSEVQASIDRLDVGLSTLRKTAADVAELQVDLVHTMEVVAEKKAATEALLEVMGVERIGAEKQQAVAAEEAVKSGQAAAAAAIIETEADKELSQAKPAMEAASGAVDCLSKAMLTELKSLPKPPAGVDEVTKCCLIMLEHEYKNHKWDRAKKMMANVDKFKEALQNYRGEDIPENVVAMIKPSCEAEHFTPELMQNKSAAAANLCSWVVNIYIFNRIYVKVKPLMESLEEARATKLAAETKLAEVMAEVAIVEAKLQDLQDTFTEATEEKMQIEAKAAACNDRLGLAHRLVSGLSSENERWGVEIEHLKESGVLLVGDVMLAAAFVSYIGAFDKALREELWIDTWQVDLDARGIPKADGIDPVTGMLTNDSKTAMMFSEGLPSDRISVENGSIVTNCARWPLLIDPQLQAIKWIREKEKDNNLNVFQLSQKRWINTLESAIQNGWCVIIENLQEDIDATMDPVIARAIYKKGRGKFLKLGGEEVEYDERFQLYLITKLANPHYKPEIAAQCTLINFLATEVGLEDQLLQRCVKEEQPAMEAQKTELVAAFQRYKMELHQLEDNLLDKLANAPEDILSDVPLIIGLEDTKAASVKINAAVAKGKETEIKINLAREVYRRVATEGAMLYFMLTELCLVEHMYQYSLDSYVLYFYKSFKGAKPGATDEERVLNLRESLRFTIFTWISRGLFVRHKLVFLSKLCFNLIERGIVPEEVNALHFNFLLRGPTKIGTENPLDWLPKQAWEACNALCDLEEFQKFGSDLVEASPRFREWYNHNTPETEKLPLDWASLDKTPFLKMLVLRCLRPDRMTVAIANYVKGVLPNGLEYANCDSTLNTGAIVDESLGDSSTITPLYFILSPGVDVVAEVEKLTAKYEIERATNYHNVSMGQGQDVVAMDRLEQAHRNGGWVILNNIHLMPKWCQTLEKRLDEYALEGSHTKFRLFLTSDPNIGIPIGILNRSIKLTNEPPAGLKANLKRAWCSFSKEYVDEADSKTKSILFGLCHFHAILIERKLYGPLGYNMMYPFGVGDLRDSAVCLNNYMEANQGGKIPWADLQYIFGEIMYGGHIVNDFDRLLSANYLEFFMKDDLLEETEMYPFAEDEKGLSFKSPLPTSHVKTLEHIEETMTVDTPVAFGLHTNAEIDFRTTQAGDMFHILVELGSASGGGGGDEDGGSVAATPQDVAAQWVTECGDRFGEKGFDVEDVSRGCEEVGPYQNVFLQEMAQMNVLLVEIARSLKELALGLAGELSMSDSMDTLQNCLFLDRQPPLWSKRAWPSKRPLTTFLADMAARIVQLEEWTGNPMEIPRCTWLSGLITPQSFLTAICQVTAQKAQLELDKLQVQTEVTKRTHAEVDAPSRDGALVHGLSLQGARWDVQGGLLEKSKPKEMFCDVPVLNCKALLSEKCETNGIYQCPMYKTTMRGPTFVICATLKTKTPIGKWVLAGVALIMDTA